MGFEAVQGFQVVDTGRYRHLIVHPIGDTEPPQCRALPRAVYEQAGDAAAQCAVTYHEQQFFLERVEPPKAMSTGRLGPPAGALRK
jgi:hypothetical protein